MLTKESFKLKKSNLFILIGLIITLIVSGAVFKQPLYEILISISSILMLVYLVEGKRVACIFGMVYFSTYSIVCFLNKIYGVTIFNLVVCFPIQIITFITWKKNATKGTVKTKQLKPKELLIVATVAAVIIACGYFVLNMLNSQNAIFDSMTMVIGATSLVLMNLRYSDQWLFSIVSNGSLGVIWFLKTLENPANLSFLIAVIAFTVYSVYGWFSWKKLSKSENN